MRDLDDDYYRPELYRWTPEEEAKAKQICLNIGWGNCHYIAQKLKVTQLEVFIAVLELEMLGMGQSDLTGRACWGCEDSLQWIACAVKSKRNPKVVRYVFENSSGFIKAKCEALAKFIKDHQETWDRMTAEINHPVEDWSKPDADLFAEGKKIRTYRKENDITQTAAMALFGCTLVELGRMERGFHVRDGLLAHTTQLIQFGPVVPAAEHVPTVTYVQPPVMHGHRDIPFGYMETRQ